MITWLGSRMDDIVAESKSAAPREVLRLLLNLSSGEQHFERVNYVAPKSSLLDPSNQRCRHKNSLVTEKRIPNLLQLR